MSARIQSVERHLAHVFHGKVEILAVESDLLRGNPLGDSNVRELICYTPQGVDESSPYNLYLPGFTSRPHAALETHPWRRGLISEYDQRLAQRDPGPSMRLVLPDAFTRLGGSQYVNSKAVGPYASFIIDEVIPLATEHLGASPYGVLGKSSGGFGALHLCMHHPGTFAACGSISGDCGFDALFPPEFLACLRGLLAYDSDPKAFLESFFAEPDLGGDGHAVLNVLAMAACYSPNPKAPLGFDLPMDLETGELREDVWQRFLAFDPLVDCERHVEALAGLDLLHIECGLRDEFHLQWGARRLSRKLAELRVAHSHEEHPGGHRGIDERALVCFDRFAQHRAHSKAN